MARIDKAVLPGIIERLKAGSTSLGQEARALGMSYRTTLILALRDFMGRDKYDELMAAKRPRAGFAAGHVARALPDDSKVPTVASMRKSDGWTSRHVAEHAPIPRTVEITNGGKKEGSVTVMDTGRPVLVMRSPEGVEYTYADDTEKAHLLMPNRLRDGSVIRFVRWEGSAAQKRNARAEQHHQEQVERGAAALKRRRTKGAAVAVVEPSPTPEPAAKGKGGGKATKKGKAMGKAAKQGKGKRSKSMTKA